jgi:signal transduction histidine kinase
VVEARLAGLLIAGLSMTALFFVLLGIVRRADRLITARSDELSRAYTDLRAAEAMRDDLTDMIVHDLRTPLTTVTVNLDLMARLADDPTHQNTQRRFLSNARDSTKRIVGLINDLLDVSKLEAGQLHPMREWLSILDLLHERAAVFAIQAEAENKQIAVEAEAELPSALADPSLVSRELDNLISNALKYTSSGGHVRLSAARNGRMLRLSVNDDGEGIPAEYIERIFDKFVQVPDDNRSRRRGTGLGLTFCKLAVEAHGGQIWAKSTPGQGSAFFFTLPMQTAE